MKTAIRLALWMWVISYSQASYAGPPNLSIASATTIENAGLYAALLPVFTQQTGIQVRVLSVGTGHALNLARDGDADILLVHHTPSEQQFVDDGFGVKRFDLMYNDFILVGPANDPAGVNGMKDIHKALQQIAQSKSPFISRADDSGTHKKESEIWQALQIDTERHSGKWYFETGTGMGTTLNIANGMGAYTLSDRGTWLKYARNVDMPILVEGDPALFNQYGIVMVNPVVHPHINTSGGRPLIEWLLSDLGQSAINNYRINGEQAFFANAGEDLRLGQGSRLRIKTRTN